MMITASAATPTHPSIPLSFIPSKNMAGLRAPLFLALLAVAVAVAPVEARNLHKVQHHSLFDLGHVCKEAPFPDICKELIPKLTAQNPPALIQALLQAALSASQEAEAAAAKLMADPTIGHSMKIKVEQVKEGYDMIMSSLKTATEQAISGSGDVQHEIIMDGITAAQVYAGQCEKIIFKNPELMDSPLHQFNFKLGKLVANLSLAIDAELF